MWTEILTEDEVRDEVRAACEVHGTQAAFAESIGVSANFVNMVIKGSKKPSAKVLEALGIERVTVYRWIS